MISTEVLLTTTIVMLMTTIVPIVVMVFLMIKKKISIGPLFCGAGAFFVSQIILRIPIMTALATAEWYQKFTSTVIGIIVVGGLTAGLFEESARLVSAKFILKKHRTYKDTISFGLGHGLCEVVILVGMTMVNNLILMLAIKNDNLDMFTMGLPEETKSSLILSLCGVTSLDLVLSLVERVSSVMFHVFATVLVFKGVREKKIVYYFLAILAHTALNSLVLIPNIYVVETIMLALTSIATVYTVRAKKSFEDKTIEAQN